MIVICDIDGCLANVVSYVEEYLTKRNDWREYFTHTLEFLPIEGTFCLVNSLIAEGHEVVFVSGRPESNRILTKKWLLKYLELIKDDKLTLYLRGKKDIRTNSEVKLDLYKQIRKKKPEATMLVIDDEPLTIEAALKEGFLPLQVHGFRATTNDQIPPKEI